ncbi:hypothetical protein E1B28_008329 [Marasmius oreades]|uniref:Fungal-type protein kinase domain-containing protein n=1 Tax=Marasmius oreades TaxID=181124 RepID=A0A9P7URN1_9AGAR|nr:uncharacterized protein E1B28_008329 [Marasmius oreades]KAG7091937.1 hypothetical protein E1B28_008329 [Marasmius oreades]
MKLSPDKFLETFLPVPKGILEFRQLTLSDDALEKASICGAEIDMYPHLVDAFEAYCHGLDCWQTYKHPAHAPYGKQDVEIKPDISVYHRRVGQIPTISEAASEKPTSLEAACSQQQTKEAPPVPAHLEEACTGSQQQTKKAVRPPKIARVNLEEVEIMIEAKVRPADDAFSDRTSTFEASSIQGRGTRGQITMYATAQLALQQRTHCFSVLVIGTFARLIRWDRSGAIVTERFDYTRSNWLQKFLYLYQYATPKVRGIDTSVYSLGNCDDALIRASEQLARDRLNLPHEPLYIFEIYDDTTRNVRRVIGSKPCVRNTSSLTGRCTRCYKVYDPKDEGVRVLKDTWRISAPDVLGEAVAYSKLKAAGVRNILTLVTSGDVRYRGSEDLQATQSHYYRHTDSGGPLNQLRGHYHCCLLFMECGEDLLKCKTVGIMISVIRDALIAHKDAYEKACIIHRDISPGNIIMLDGKGFLIDWDVAKFVSETTARQNERTGTWQFISARLLMATDPTLHVLADDLESFFHVLSWQILRYTKHFLSTVKLIRHLRKVYEEVEEVDKDEVNSGSHACPNGGESKCQALSNQFMKSLQVPNKFLHTLLVDLEEVLRIRYVEEPEKKEQEEVDRIEQQFVHAWDNWSESLRELRAAFTVASNLRDTWLHHNKLVNSLKDHNYVLACFNRASDAKDKMPENLELKQAAQLYIEPPSIRKRKVDGCSNSMDVFTHWNKKAKLEPDEF